MSRSRSPIYERCGYSKTQWNMLSSAERRSETIKYTLKSVAAIFGSIGILVGIIAVVSIFQYNETEQQNNSICRTLRIAWIKCLQHIIH